VGNEETLKELEEILDLAHHIQGQLNIIDDAIIKISGNLLHNLEGKIYQLQDKLIKKPEEITTPDAASDMRKMCQYDD